MSHERHLAARPPHDHWRRDNSGFLAEAEPVSGELVIAGNRVAVTIEAGLWGKLDRIAAQEGVDLTQLVARVADCRPAGCSLPAALRVFAASYRS